VTAWRQTPLRDRVEVICFIVWLGLCFIGAVLVMIGALPHSLVRWGAIVFLGGLFLLDPLARSVGWCIRRARRARR
jgi:hypothetical protein